VIGPELERARPAEGPGFADAVTFAFGDAAAGIYGSTRLGLLPGEPPRATALGLLFTGGDAVATTTGGGDAGDDGWERFSAAGITATIVEPLRRWRLALDAEGAGFELDFEALSEPVEIGADTAVARAAGLRGYEQPCRVKGTARAGGGSFAINALGQRGHQWGAADWERMESARSVSAWLGPELSAMLSAVRPTGSRGHDEEAISAFVVESAGEGLAGVIGEIDEPRLSTLYDAAGRQRRASAELWPAGEDPYPRRLAGSILCGTSVELGPLALDAAFFAWSMDGREGVGRYDVLRRTTHDTGMSDG